jgi:hypothetical protein
MSSSPTKHEEANRARFGSTAPSPHFVRVSLWTKENNAMVVYLRRRIDEFGIDL